MPTSKIKGKTPTKLSATSPFKWGSPNQAKFTVNAEEGWKREHKSYPVPVGDRNLRFNNHVPNFLRNVFWEMGFLEGHCCKNLIADFKDLFFVDKKYEIKADWEDKLMKIEVDFIDQATRDRHRGYKNQGFAIRFEFEEFEDNKFSGCYSVGCTKTIGRQTLVSKDDLWDNDDIATNVKIDFKNFLVESFENAFQDPCGSGRLKKHNRYKEIEISY